MLPLTFSYSEIAFKLAVCLISLIDFSLKLPIRMWICIRTYPAQIV